MRGLTNLFPSEFEAAAFFCIALTGSISFRSTADATHAHLRPNRVE